MWKICQLTHLRSNLPLQGFVTKTLAYKSGNKSIRAHFPWCVILYIPANPSFLFYTVRFTWTLNVMLCTSPFPEMGHKNTCCRGCATASKDQHVHLDSLIRVFTVHIMLVWILGFRQMKYLWLFAYWTNWSLSSLAEELRRPHILSHGHGHALMI